MPTVVTAGVIGNSNLLQLASAITTLSPVATEELILALNHLGSRQVSATCHMWQLASACYLLPVALATDNLTATCHLWQLSV